MTNQTRLVQLRTKILKANDVAARRLRQRFPWPTRCMSLVWYRVPVPVKPCSWNRTLTELRQRGKRVAALVGDLATDNDAARLGRAGVPVRQITTGTVCHLEAEMVEAAIGHWKLDQLDLLFIENVGNLVCPATYDLGEDLRAGDVLDNRR